MGRRSHTRALSLWMNGVRVGTWLMAPHSPDTLQYAPKWMQSREGRPLSLSLPFTPGNTPHRGERVRHYFDNLLPDSPDSARWAAAPHPPAAGRHVPGYSDHP